LFSPTMQYYLLITALICSIYLVCSQPSNAPSVDFYLNAGTPIKTGWWWPTSSLSALQPGKTYVLGGNLNGVNGYAEFNVSFTYSSSCSATSYNSAGPSGNQGWRYVFSQASTTSELAAAPSQGISVFAGPTSFGTSRAPKMSLYLDYVDVCGCIFVNWVGYITQDPLNSGYGAHYWNGQTEKRSSNVTVHKKQGCGSAPCAGKPYCGPGNWQQAMACSQGGCACTYSYSKGGTALGPGYSLDINSAMSADKRSTNYFLYWVNVTQPACTGIPNVGSYGNGPSGSVAAFTSLGVTYI